MEEKFQSILDNYDQQLFDYEEKVKYLQSKIKFYSNHKFEEELRITRVKFDELNMVVYRWRNMVNELRDLLASWQS